MSENAICFFSGTGNSFDIATRLAAKIPDTTVYNIAAMTSFDELANCKRVGIVFPIYGFTAPNIVKRFIQQLPMRNDTYYFCVAALGALELGAFYRTAEMFKAAGGHLDYAAKIYMPENYILFSRVPSDRIIKSQLADSVKRVDKISGDVLACKVKPIKEPITYRFSQKASDTESAKWKDMSKGFEVAESCTKCRKCVRLCPVNNISMENDTITFGGSCECCLLCMHSCPVQAINYGVKTIGKKRYINPNINIEDMKKRTF